MLVRTMIGFDQNVKLATAEIVASYLILNL